MTSDRDNRTAGDVDVDANDDDDDSGGLAVGLPGWSQFPK